MPPLTCSLALRGGRDFFRSRMRSVAQCARHRLRPHSSSGTSPSGSQNPTRSLLNLPTDILDIIIEHVLLEDSHTAPSLVDERRKQASPKSIYPDPLGRMQVHVQPNPLANSTWLFVCRKLTSLTRAVINRLDGSNRSVFKLDVLLIGERQLWTTWLLLPFVTKHIKRLEISVRIADGHQELQHPTKPDYLLASTIRNPYNPQLLDLSFQYLLAAVVCRGPMLDLQDRERRLAALDDMPRDRPTLVDHLQINVSTCEGVPIAADSQHQDWLLARPEREMLASTSLPPVTVELQSLAMRPQWLAKRLEGAFEEIILSEEHDCQLFFNRIGDASILADGVPYSLLEFGHKFADLKPAFNPDEGWWRDTQQRRLAHKFPVGSVDQSLASTSSVSMLLSSASNQDHN